jgi:hypothetical protein
MRELYPPMSARLQETAWSEYEAPRYVSYTLGNFREIPQIHNLSKEKQFEVEVVGNVLPFKTNNYVVDNLIDWNNPLADPIFILTFPQKEMLKSSHYSEMSTALKRGQDRKTIQSIANKIRLQLNPANLNTTFQPYGMAQSCMGCNTSTRKQCCSFLVRARHVMRIARFALDGHNL